MIEKIKKLCSASGASGRELSASIVAKEYLIKYCDNVKIDDFNNVIGFLNEDRTDLPLILLDAHIDEIGMVVTYIDDNGFIKVGNIGGLDRRLLFAQEVIVHGKEDVFGVIGSKPPHLLKGDESKKVPAIDDIFIDIGYTKEKAETIISLGDTITIKPSLNQLLNNMVSIKSMDDRIGCISIIEAIELLVDRKDELKYRIAVVFSAGEEVGGYGASISSFDISPDYCIAIDVGFGYTPDAIEHKCGKINGGAMIGYAPILNKKLCDKLVSIAKEKEIPYQLDIMNRTTGTNADSVFTTKNGVKTGVVSIPLRYMHTPIETCSTNDVESVAKLLVEFLTSEF